MIISILNRIEKIEQEKKLAETRNAVISDKKYRKYPFEKISENKEFEGMNETDVKYNRFRRKNI